MSFDDKIKEFFLDYVLVYINKYPKNYSYVYSDYAELLALINNSNFVTTDDFLDRLEESFVLDKRFLRNDNEEEDDFEVDPDLSDEDNSRAELNDLKQKFSESIFRVLIERNTLFEDDYPFEVDKNKIILKENLTNRHKVYLMLLLCSSLDIFNKFNHELTSDFEMLAYYVLLNFLPEHAIVKSFGKKSEYVGTAREKITALAADLKIAIKQAGFSQISERNRQEKGLDLIGWIPFDDSISNILCILCQCACQKEWNGKLAEAGRYKNYLDFHRLEPLNSLFIPYNIISISSDSFIRNDEITISTLIFERKRILNYIIDAEFFLDLESSTLIDKCIEYQEPLV